MILLIDNYDSFVYNLYQLIGSIEPDIRVVRNDACTLPQIEEMGPEAAVLSPGPGRPEDAGICIDLVRHFAGRLPVFGVCLGHQAVCRAFGAEISYANSLMHGKASDLVTEPDSVLFHGRSGPFRAGRYHSLAAVPSTVPECLRVSARTVEGEIMAVEHREYPVFGVQFHPESILTPDGAEIIKNFMDYIRR